MARLTGSLGLTMILCACGPGLSQSPVSDSTEPVQLEVVYRGSRCAAVEPGIQVIRDTAAWTEWKRQRDRQVLSATDGPDDEATVIDFGQLTVIVISMGQRPTPGYAVEVPEDSAVLQGESLIISSVWQRPAEGAILPQVLTSPCVAFTVPAAQYNAVQIKNEQGVTVLDHQN